MTLTADEQEIVGHILASRKYRDVYRPIVERIVTATPVGVRIRDREDMARNGLHQIWGAYWETRPDFSKLLGKVEPMIQDPGTRRETLLTLLRLHASTRERLATLPSFFSRIWEVTGPPNSIVDHGCGFMPLAFPWMRLPDKASYSGYDIDMGQNRFVRQLLGTMGMSVQLAVQEGDLLTETFPAADAVFMLKLLPLLEQQVGWDAMYETVARQECRWLVISYPTASLGGREKGMATNYRHQFEALIKKFDRKYVELAFPDELVFVIDR